MACPGPAYKMRREGDFLRVELPCRSGGAPLGRVTWEEKGPRLAFDCRLPAGAGVCKLWLVRGERKLLLGTPAPEGAELTLHRVLSLSLLRAQGVYPPEWVEVTGAGAAPGPESGEEGRWRPAGEGVPALEDAPLRRMLAQGGWVWRRRGQGVELCHGWAAGAPFPAAPLFCLARVVEQDHKIQVRFYLDGAGRPCLPP